MGWKSRFGFEDNNKLDGKPDLALKIKISGVERYGSVHNQGEEGGVRGGR